MKAEIIPLLVSFPLTEPHSIYLSVIILFWPSWFGLLYSLVFQDLEEKIAMDSISYLFSTMEQNKWTLPITLGSLPISMPFIFIDEETTLQKL